MIIATRRLYLTADKQRLVHEGDPAAATLYAAIGDRIPESAAVAFGLDNDGALMTTPNADWVRLTGIDGIDRATARALALAGITDARRLAEIDMADLPALPGYGGAVAWGSWIDGAKALLAAEEAARAAAGKEKAPAEDKERAPQEDKGDDKTAEPVETDQPSDVLAEASDAPAELAEAPKAPAAWLDDIDGIGPATIAALARIGITDAHQLAAIDPAAPPALDGYRGTPAWSAWIDGAKALGPVAPAQVETLAGAPAAPALAADAADGAAG